MNVQYFRHEDFYEAMRLYQDWLKTHIGRSIYYVNMYESSGMHNIVVTYI